jgi:type IV pilus assembly protein PilW
MNKTFLLKSSAHSSRRQQGLTLIELLLSMLLGVFVITGAIQIFIGTKQTYRTQEAVSRLQENGRFALDIFQQSLRMTGYRNDPAKDIDKVFVTSENSVFSQGQIIEGLDGDGSGSDADSVIFRYSSPDSNQNSNCLGMEYSGNMTVRFSLDDNGALRCSIDNGSPQPIVNGIRDMELVYGVDLNLDRSADTYLTATEITSAIQWLHIVSVKVALLISTDEDQIVSEPQTYTFPPVGFGVESQPQTATDHRLYRIFNTTVNLRNRTL